MFGYLALGLIHQLDFLLQGSFPRRGRARFPALMLVLSYQRPPWEYSTSARLAQAPGRLGLPRAYPAHAPSQWTVGRIDGAPDPW